MGPTIAGFSDNFALDALILGDGQAGHVGLIDLFDNQPAWGGAEALYAETLVLADGSMLDLNGLHLYVLAFDDRGGTVLGGEVPLHSAAAGGHRHVCFLLLVAGANPVATNRLRQTPLHFAATRNTARVLVEWGATIFARDREGRTAAQNSALGGGAPPFSRASSSAS